MKELMNKQVGVGKATGIGLIVAAGLSALAVYLDRRWQRKSQAKANNAAAANNTAASSDTAEEAVKSA